MTQSISNLDALLTFLEPELHAGVYAYCTVSPEIDVSTLAPVVTVVEAEGITLVLPEEEATSAGLDVLFRAAWITLTVHSDLQAVGLTAAVASALGEAGISCNVVAGAYHDHVFVPIEQGEAAVAAIVALQQAATE